MERVICVSDLKERVGRYVLCRKRSNKVGDVKHYSGSHSGLSLGGEYASGWVSLKKPPYADTRQESKDAVLEKIPFLNVS